MSEMTVQQVIKYRRDVENKIQEVIGFHLNAFVRDTGVNVSAVYVDMLDASCITAPRNYVLGKVRIKLELED